MCDDCSSVINYKAVHSDVNHEAKIKYGDNN